MRILIVEDDHFKCRRLESFFLGENSLNLIFSATNLVDAVDRINEGSFDLIIVDMAIPSHPLVKGGGAPTSLLSGGVEVLLNLSFKKRKEPCIVVTQFPDIKISGEFYDLIEASNILNDRFKCNVLSCIEYKEDNDTWEDKLRKILEGL